MHSNVMVSEQTFCTTMAAILNQIDLLEYQGAPKQHEHDLIYSLNIYTLLLAQFFLKGKKIKIAVPCFDVIMITFFPRNMLKRFLFARKSCINTERVPPGFQFNMATISVKRSIHNITISDHDARRVLELSLYYSHFEITEFSHQQYLFDLETGLMKSNNKKAATFHYVPRTEMIQLRARMRSFIQITVQNL